jgi:hypothetical protein
MIVQVPKERRYNFSMPDQTEALPGHFTAIVDHIRRYQAYKQQVQAVHQSSTGCSCSCCVTPALTTRSESSAKTARS